MLGTYTNTAGDDINGSPIYKKDGKQWFAVKTVPSGFVPGWVGSLFQFGNDDVYDDDDNDDDKDDNDNDNDKVIPETAAEWCSGALPSVLTNYPGTGESSSRAGALSTTPPSLWPVLPVSQDSGCLKKGGSASLKTIPNTLSIGNRIETI